MLAKGAVTRSKAGGKGRLQGTRVNVSHRADSLRNVAMGERVSSAASRALRAARLAYDTAEPMIDSAAELAPRSVPKPAAKIAVSASGAYKSALHITPASLPVAFVGSFYVQ
jgi:hypothetical protein